MIVVGVLLLIALLVLGFGVRWYLDPGSKLSIVQRKDLVQGMASAAQALAVFLTGAVGLAGLFFTWHSTRRTLELTEQGQITDRFTKAIDQLGKAGDEDEKIEEIRLGGIYALEHIAVERPDIYHWPIMRVLAAYVRRYATWRDDPSRLTTRPADVETALSVIGRRSHFHRVEGNEPLSLSGTDLSGYVFPTNAQLEGAILTEAHFENATLVKAHLRNADLRGTHLVGAYLQGADLRGADLRGTHLEGAYLQRADLRGANLGNAHLAATYLAQAKLQGARNLDPNSLKRANGASDTELGEGPRPGWWNNQLPLGATLPPGNYSTKLFSEHPLHFSVPAEGWTPGEDWHSVLIFPYGVALTPAGAFFTGSGLFLFDGQWVCHPHKPKETFTLDRVEPGGMVAWFDEHPYLSLTTEPCDWENPRNGLRGTQFLVETDTTVADTEIDSGLEGPRVPIFPAYTRLNNYALVKGKKNRVIVFERERDAMVFVIEASPDEFDRFDARVEEAILPNVYWGADPD